MALTDAFGGPRRETLAVLPTPLIATPRLASAMGIRGRLFVKRDDLTGFAVAGNKARALEPLIADALARRATVVVTGGTAGSNFCQAASAAAAWAGMRCVLVLAGDESRHPNLSAARHWGADVRWTGDPDRSTVDTSLESVASELRLAGERPYVCPRGGATALGASGFHRAAGELHAQLQVTGPTTVVIPVGSGGSVAGLISGTIALGRPWTVAGASVSRPPDESVGRILELAAGCARLHDTAPPARDDIHLIDARGPGHGLASTEGIAASDSALRAEGLVLDPVYSAKALGAMRQILGEARHDPTATTIFWHTGGLLDAVAGWEQHDH